MSLASRLKYFAHFLKSVLELNLRLLGGMWRLTRIPQPAVTVFGGSRIGVDDQIGLQASLLAKKLAEHGFSIITGGGPGIMEAANFGALAYLKECKVDGVKVCRAMVSGAVGLVHLNQERVNPYVQTSVIMDHFFSRKWLLVRYSSAFVFFPGGFGTMDELFEVLTLVQTGKMPAYPIILIGAEYWKPILEWISTRALAQNLIQAGDEKIFIVVDDVQLAVDAIKQYHGLKN
jgi:uncharacterized protein (TIGR00730 family)